MKRETAATPMASGGGVVNRSLITIMGNRTPPAFVVGSSVDLESKKRYGNDEIAILAIECLALGNDGCLEAIERHISFAQTGGDWDEMSKWHRVRLRAQRLTREQELTRDRRPCLGIAQAVAAAGFTHAPI